MSLDLLIVHPGASHGIYGALGDELTAVEPPLWARLIAGYVRDRGFSVKILDAEAEGLNPKAVAQRVGSEAPRLVCLAVYGHQPSASTQQMVGASAIAHEIKKYLPNTKVIMVGGHVSALPERTLREEPVDYIAIGEGPVTVTGLLKYLTSRYAEDAKIGMIAPGFHGIPGLGWREPGTPQTIHLNPSAPLLDVAQLHGDAWDLLPMNRYRAHNWQCFGDLSTRKPYASIYTSLGCPYKCSFCCINAPFESNRYRMRDPTDVVREIMMLRIEYGVRTFKIVDEMFVLNERHYTAIARGLVEKGMSADLNIWAYARVDTVKPETLAPLRSAGFRWLALGIESGSKHVRDGAQKALKNEDIVGTVRAIQAAGINVIGNYIFGLPDDNLRSMRQTLDLACELNTEFANFYSAMAYPGSRLYDEAVAKGAALPETWRGYSQHNDDCRPLDTEHISAAQVLSFRDAAFRYYFDRTEYRDMVWAKFGPGTVKHVDRMLSYKLTRKLLAA